MQGAVSGGELEGIRGGEMASFEDLRFEICSSYIKHAAEKLAQREAELIAQSALFIAQFTRNDFSRDLTDVCSTEATSDSFLRGVESPRGSEKRIAFQRKSRRAIDRKTESGIGEAVQEVREVCSWQTVSLMERVVGEWRRASEELAQMDSREVVKKKRERCQNCADKDALLQLRNTQYEEKISLLKLEMGKLEEKNCELGRTVGNWEAEHREVIQKNRDVFNSCKEYLQEKEAEIAQKNQEIRTLESNISASLQVICEMQGCGRCEVIRRVKGQIVELRRYYQRQCETLQKIYFRWRVRLSGASK